MRLLACFATVLLSSGGALHAQVAAPDSVPRELAVALLGGPGAIENLRVGRAADGFPAELIPGSTAVVASLVRGTEALTVVSYPLTVRAALDTMQARLLGSGWATPPATTGIRPPRGFAPTPPTASANPSANVIQLCRGTTTRLRATAVPRDANASQLTFSIVTGGSGCESRPPTAMLDNPLLPKLDPPPASRIDQGVWDGNPTSFQSQGRLATQLGITEVSRFFAEQLVRAGWVAGDSSSSAGLHARAFQFSEPAGRVWLGMLTVTAPTDNRGFHLYLWGRPR